MNSPSHRNYPAEDSLQNPADEAAQDTSRFAPDAPPLRADEFDPEWTGESDLARSEAIAQSELDRLEQILSAEQMRIRRRMASADFMPPPPRPVARKRAGFRWAVGTFAVLVTGSALIAMQTTGKLPLLDSVSTDTLNTRLASLVSTQDTQETAAVRQQAAEPAASQNQSAQPARLVVNGATADNAEHILIGIAAENAAADMTAVVSGLVPGTVLSTGKPWGNTGWIVPAHQLATTYIKPPSGFSGTMEYSVALHRPDNSVLDRQTMRLEWSAPTAQAPAPSQQQPVAAAPAEPSAQAQAAVRNLSQDEIDLMVARGTELLKNGDIASARLLLQRAAEARDSRAALALAASYDPNELKKLGVYGSNSDVAVARDWYEKARQFGSREAPRRLELLASQFR
ncbi:MAG: hypothetical protein IT539_01615 [Bradyrhizobiaceae bacterium]|nr:hypothetical protein [Bradyrhizobiaceae bacterium]